MITALMAVMMVAVCVFGQDHSHKILDDLIESYNLTSFVRVTPLPCFNVGPDEIIVGFSSLDHGTTNHHVYKVDENRPSCTRTRGFKINDPEVYDNLETPILFDLDKDGSLLNVSYLCKYISEFPYEMMLNDHTGHNLPHFTKQYIELKNNKQFLSDFSGVKKQYNLLHYGLGIKHIICKFYCPKAPTYLEHTCNFDERKFNEKLQTIPELKKRGICR